MPKGLPVAVPPPVPKDLISSTIRITKQKKPSSPLPYIIGGGIAGFILMGLIAIPLVLSTGDDPEKGEKGKKEAVTKKEKKGEEKKKEPLPKEEKKKEDKKEDKKEEKKSDTKETIPQREIDYSAIDKYALATPKEEEKTPGTLGAYLGKGAKNDREKARAIYRWIADRIVYDVVRFNKKDFSTESQFPETLLKERIGICAGYAALFEELARFASLPNVKTIGGFAKDENFVPGGDIKSNHAWNAILLEGKWHLIDVTWGAGSSDGNSFQKGFNDFYFLCKPENFIYRHFPERDQDQFLDPPVTSEEIQAWPFVPDDLMRFGVSSRAIRGLLKNPKEVKFPKSYRVPKGDFLLKEIPLNYKVNAEKIYRYEVESREFQQMALIQNKKFYFFENIGGVFQLEIAMPPGEFTLSARIPGDNSFWSILSYESE